MKRPIFLSAGVPDREPFASDSDPVAIREAILALVAVTVRERELVFGGHPAISPLVEHAARSLGALENVHIFQSRFFEEAIPEVAKEFPNLHWTAISGKNGGTREESLKLMRQEMISSRDFYAAVFVGGMEGIFEEFELFRKIRPAAKVFTVASTGGAARTLMNDFMVAQDELSRFLLTDENRYRRVFRTLLGSE